MMPEVPGINHQRAVKAFEKAGSVIARQRKHITMTNGEHIITIPRSNPVNSFTMAGIIKSISIEELKKLNNYETVYNKRKKKKFTDRV